MATYVLGVSGLYHDSAAALLCDGQVVAAAQEERFTRRKNDPSLPVQAIAYCLGEGRVGPGELDIVAYYEKPMAAFVRVLKTFAAVGWRGTRTFPHAMEEALRRKLWVSFEIDRALRRLQFEPPRRTVFAEHHVSHASAAFYPSPFNEAAILTFDGVGEWATTSIGIGRGRRIDLLEEMRFPCSIGLLYSSFTVAAGFGVNSGEYKLMGLAPFGQPTYYDRILTHLIDLRDDGSFTVDLSFFDYLAGSRMTNASFDRMFDGPPRSPAAPITRRECDLACSIQLVVEEIVLRAARHAHDLTGAESAVLGGGVALNCVANARLLTEGPFRELWVQPAAGDAGSALGCALWAWHEVEGHEREATGGLDGMRSALLGPEPFPGDVSAALDRGGRPHERISDLTARSERLARLLADGSVVGVCSGRMEFGPRALGARSILADPRGRDMQDRLNRAVKNRESFRPFAPIVPAEHAAAWFELDHASPYMSFVARVRHAELPPADSYGGEPSDEIDLGARLAAVRSPVPAVTHVDATARVQTVDRDSHPEMHALLTAFGGLTGCPILVNTSFNVRGEPIVATMDDAYRCFMTTDMDWLLVGDCLLSKQEQPAWAGPAALPSED